MTATNSTTRRSTYTRTDPRVRVTITDPAHPYISNQYLHIYSTTEKAASGFLQEASVFLGDGWERTGWNLESMTFAKGESTAIIEFLSIEYLARFYGEPVSECICPNAPCNANTDVMRDCRWDCEACNKIRATEN